MAEEPQPANPGPAPSAAEKKREEAALSNLSTQNMTSDDADGSSGPDNATDTAALGAAVSNLAITGNEDVVGSTGKAGAGTADTRGTGASAAGAQKEEVAKKIKIDQADVTFLVRELEVSKKKAGEMLQASGGDKDAAVRVFVTPVKI